jgi:iron only hydrogenase large subunit-like protein
MKIDPGQNCIASIAPSFPAFFDCHPLQLVTALKTAGFAHVEETVVVLPEILERRIAYATNSSEPLISESCPRVIQMILEEFPHLTKQIAPIPSPMELHGQKLKEKYGSDSITYFFSPCEFKKIENDQKQAMDHVVSFAELHDFLELRIKQPLDSLSKTNFDSHLEIRETRLGVLAMSIHGPEQCRHFLRKFSDGNQSKFSEVLFCTGGCAQRAIKNPESLFTAVERILNVWEDYL